MCPELSLFSRAYKKALRQHLTTGAPVGIAAAQRLGRRAAAMKLETLDLAHLYDDCLHSIISPAAPERAGNAMILRAREFFAETLMPIEETHRSVRQLNEELQVSVGRLTQRTAELASANAELQHEIARRRAVEDSLLSSETTSRELLEKSRLMQEELRQLSRRLLTVQEDERKSISRELHDVIGQTLAGVYLQLATLKGQSVASTRELQRRITITQRLVEKSVAMVHRFARNLRPAVLDDLGLIPAMQAFFAGFTAETGLPVEFTSFPGVEKRDGSVRTVLYRVMQEALANVVHHARATRVVVHISNRRGTLRMEITDNGMGVPQNGARAAGVSTRLGLLGMRERVEMVGGSFSVQSIPGLATTICVEFPPCRHKAKSKSSAKV